MRMPRTMPTTPLHIENIRAIGEAIFMMRQFSLVGPKTRQWAALRLAEAWVEEALRKHHHILPPDELHRRIAFIHECGVMLRPTSKEKT